MVRIKLSKKELEMIRKRRIEERKRFIEMYVEWLKKQRIEEWSKQQKKLIDAQLQQRKK